MGKNNGARLLIAILLIVTFLTLSVVSIIEYLREPTPEEIGKYISEHAVPPPGSQGRGKASTEAVSEKVTESPVTEKHEEQTTDAPYTEDTVTEIPASDEEALAKALLPSDAVLYPASDASGITGTYEGRFYYTELAGYDTMSGAPENIREMMDAERENTPGFTVRIYKDGKWEFAADSQMGPKLDYDILRDPGDAEAGLSGIELIRNINNGHFEAGREMTQDPDEIRVYWDGTIYEKNGKSEWVIAGTLEIYMKHGDEYMSLRGYYSADYTGKAE